MLPIVICYALLCLTYGWQANASHQSDLADLDLFKISWKGPLAATENFNEDNVINISTRNNERYKCVVPDIEDHLNFDTSAKNASSVEEAKSPITIIEPLLKSNYCSYKFELFWVYELCHGKFLRQYHEENSKFKTKITQEYYLGILEPEQLAAHVEDYEKQRLELTRTGASLPTILVNGHHKPFIQFNMTDGTRCDLTKKSRAAKIIYVCNEEPKHELYSIKEISTCEYEAIVLSPLLCQHKDFKIDTNTQHEIRCFSLDGAPMRPTKTIDYDEDEDLQRANKGRGIAYFQGRTLIIEADHILAEIG